MNKELREEMEYLITCDDKVITPDVKDDVRMTLDYIDELEKQLHQASLDIQALTEKDIGCPSWCDKLNKLQEENKRLKKDKGRVVSEREDLLSSCLYQDKIIKKAIEYLKENACYENTISELFCDDLDTDSCMELLDILRGKEQ